MVSFVAMDSISLLHERCFELAKKKLVIFNGIADKK